MLAPQLVATTPFITSSNLPRFAFLLLLLLHYIICSSWVLLLLLLLWSPFLPPPPYTWPPSGVYFLGVMERQNILREVCSRLWKFTAVAELGKLDSSVFTGMSRRWQQMTIVNLSMLMYTCVLSYSSSYTYQKITYSHLFLLLYSFLSPLHISE